MGFYFSQPSGLYMNLAESRIDNGRELLSLHGNPELSVLLPMLVDAALAQRQQTPLSNLIGGYWRNRTARSAAGDAPRTSFEYRWSSFDNNDDKESTIANGCVMLLRR